MLFLFFLKKFREYGERMDGSKANPRFVDVHVEGADDCAEACLRFRAIGETRAAVRVRWSPEDGDDARSGPGWYRVYARDEQGTHGLAQAVLVEDSSAGVAMLVVGGVCGLWLAREDDDAGQAGIAGVAPCYAEPYLLLARDAVECAADVETR